MPDSLPTLQSDASCPFVILLQARDVTSSGYFRPAAFVALTPALRASGLLRDLPGEELKTLLLVLSFVSPNGDCLPTLPELAEGLRLSSRKMRARLERLQAFSWQGAPLLHRIERESGLHTYTPSLHILTTEQAPVPALEENPAPTYRAAGRAAIIAHSRSTYALPRADVEREIARLNGWPLPETEADTPTVEADVSAEERERDYLKQRLLRLGVSGEQADFLLTAYTTEEVQHQLDWLPYRNAKSPAGFIVAAIEGGYDEPRVLRLRRVLERTRAAPSEAVATALPPDGAQGEAEALRPPISAPPASVNLSLPARTPDEAEAAGDDPSLSLPS